MSVLNELIHLLELERIEENLFRGASQDLGWGAIYGGQVLAQALSAAVQTVPEDRHPHSLHAYFLRQGDASKPVVYQVDRIRDGRSFTTRRVVAVQNGRAIFHLSASFQIEEPGFTHQPDMPDAPEPESLPTDEERLAAFADRLPKKLRERALAEGPFEVRTVDPVDDPFAPTPLPPAHAYWLRSRGPVDGSAALHRLLLTYLSDTSFVTTSLRPHGVTWLTPGMQVASLDHAMWFHAPFRVDDWLLYVMESPGASGARGLVRGQIFTRDGTLVASTAQEGLIRQWEAPPAG